MLTDRQSLLLGAIVYGLFIVFGMLDSLDNIFIVGLIVLGFLVIVVNLIITKRVPEKEEYKEEASSEEI